MKLPETNVLRQGGTKATNLPAHQNPSKSHENTGKVAPAVTARMLPSLAALRQSTKVLGRKAHQDGLATCDARPALPHLKVLVRANSLTW